MIERRSRVLLRVSKRITTQRVVGSLIGIKVQKRI